jgi:hypothetical protein
MIENVGVNKLSREQYRPVLFASVDQLADIKTLNLPTGRHFGLFLACDAARISDEVMDDIAGFLLDTGLVYIYAYGQDSDRLLVRFDAETVRRNPEETSENVILTTGLRWASVDAALYSFLLIGFPASAYEKTCAFEVVICVGMAKQARRVRVILANQGPLRRRQQRSIRRI